MDHRGQGQHHCPPAKCSSFSGRGKKNAPQILGGIEELLNQCDGLSSAEMRARVHRHLLSQLLCLGRHTVTGVLRTSGRLFCDWTADYRMYSEQRVEPESLFVPVRRALTDRLKPDEPLVVALDDTRLRKSGMKTHGVKYTRDPLGPPFNVNFIKAQRFLQVSMASTAENGMARMVPIDFVHAPSPNRPRPEADEQTQAQFRQSQREMALPKIGADRMALLRAAMDGDGQHDRPLWAVVDGGYTNGTFFKNLPPRTKAIGRIRSDAKLFFLPSSTEGNPGRNRVYGDRAPTPEELRKSPTNPWEEIEAFAAGKTHRFKVKTLGPLRWRAAGGNHDLRLIVIAPLAYRLSKHSRVLYRKPAYLICTDPDAPLQEIIQAYVWRWDIEVNFRDEKSLLGVGQAQVRHQRSVENVPAFAVAAYSMLLTSAIQAFGPTGKPHALPKPKWQRKPNQRASTQSLIQHLRREAWAQSIHFSGFASRSAPVTKPQKYKPNLESALFYAVS